MQNDKGVEMLNLLGAFLDFPEFGVRCSVLDVSIVRLSSLTHIELTAKTVSFLSLCPANSEALDLAGAAAAKYKCATRTSSYSWSHTTSDRPCSKKAE